MDVLTPILTGVEYKFFLKYSTMIYHRLASYNKNVYYNSFYSSDFYFKLKLLWGKIYFYNGTCSYFPNCFIDKETLNLKDYNYKLNLISNVIEDELI